ncbi:hypothetical protein COB11_02485 [Candidatus Aerophobetes bacterium]|uniref:Ester cyclase n=1 Tax=Aerophobetes bacterium TaxID=2030807 RepID=A0A2A4YKJ7_UNCAE|nr:MAG: hypothetical protein COB11_02485 [Candidatus Aerophobetes bacterium]
MKTTNWLKPLIFLTCLGLVPCFSQEISEIGGYETREDKIFSPRSSGKSDPAYENNKELVMDFLTAIKRNDTSMISELLSHNYKVINFGEVVETSYSKFTEMSKNLKVRVNALHKALPDFDLKVSSLLAEGNKVMVQATISGIQKGDFMGIAPTNKPVHLKFITVFTISDEKILLISEMWNEINVMKQLGFIVL